MKTRSVGLILIVTIIVTIGDRIGLLSTVMDGAGLTSVTFAQAAATQSPFRIEAYNDSVAVGLSDAATYDLLLSPSGGFGGGVACNVSGLPRGVSGTFTPAGGPLYPGPFALTVTTDATVQPGTYQATVTCADKALSVATTLALAVTDSASFRVILQPNRLTVAQGQQGAANFDIKSMNGFAQGVELSASGLPSGASAVFSPAPLISPGAGFAQFTIGTRTAAGVYQLVLNAIATDGSVIRQAAFELTVTVLATASDNVGVAALLPLDGGTNVGAAVSPYGIVWDSTTVANGTHTLRAIARDAAGNTTTSAAISVTVNNSGDSTPPSVAMLAPAGGATVSGTAVTVSAMASDNVGVVGVQFKVDGTANVGAEDTTSPYGVVWNSTTSANGSHTLTAVARDAAGSTTTAAAVTVTVNNPTGLVDVAVDGSQRFQTIDGLLANVNTAAWNNGQLKPALDMLLDQGTKVFRVIIDNTDWESTNDNADPNVMNWTYYNTVYASQKFENFWATIGYLNGKGITSGIALSPMGPTAAWMGGSTVTSGMENEFVEMVASMFYYGRITRGLQFTLVQPTNEPDLYGEGVQVGPAQYALIMRKLAQRLDSLGLSDIRLFGPDTSSVDTGVNSYMPPLLADSIVMAKLAHFSFHNYVGSSATADRAIKNSAYPDRTLWMTEAGLGDDTGGADVILAQLKNNATTAGPWDAYWSVYTHRAADNLTTMIAFNSSTGIYTPTPAFYYYKQVYKFAAPGSVRIAATENGVIATAFLHVATGAVTVVGHNQGAARTLRISLTNVPAGGTWQYYETSSSRLFQRQPDVTLSNGVASFAVDAGGFFTLTTAIP